MEENPERGKNGFSVSASNTGAVPSERRRHGELRGPRRGGGVVVDAVALGGRAAGVVVSQKGAEGLPVE